MLNPGERQTLLDYLRTQRLAVVSSIAANGAPQSALVGVAVTEHRVLADHPGVDPLQRL